MKKAVAVANIVMNNKMSIVFRIGVSVTPSMSPGVPDLETDRGLKSCSRIRTSALPV